jgi:hypothetical protein
MTDAKELEVLGEIPVLFSDDVELLEDRLADIVLAMGLPEEQSNAVLRLMTDTVEHHHRDILDTFEGTLSDAEEAEAEGGGTARTRPVSF